MTLVAILIVGAIIPLRSISGAVFTCASPPTPCIGTQQNDGISGTSGNDLIDARSGDDDVFGNAGNDKIIGGPGADRLEGGPGDDLLIGGPAFTGSPFPVPNQLVGGPGFDTLVGGPNADLFCDVPPPGSLFVGFNSAQGDVILSSC